MTQVYNFQLKLLLQKPPVSFSSVLKLSMYTRLVIVWIKKNVYTAGTVKNIKW